jgi:hypothetical protein
MPVPRVGPRPAKPKQGRRYPDLMASLGHSAEAGESSAESRGRESLRSLLAWCAVGAQLGIVPGAMVWLLAVRLGLYDDRRLAWVIFGASSLAGGAVAAIMLRPNWRARWIPPSTFTAVALGAGALIAWLAGALAGDGPEYRDPSVDVGALIAMFVVSAGLVLVPLATLRWRSSLLVRWAAWLLGTVAIVGSLPFLVWLVGWPVATWGRALMLSSGVSPLRLRRPQSASIARVTAP